jgi:hypothetical protein
MMGVQGHAPAALPPGKTRHPLYKRLGEPKDPYRKTRPHRYSIPGPLISSKSLYRLSRPGPHTNISFSASAAEFFRIGQTE